jgi:hypothetical protein
MQADIFWKKSEIERDCKHPLDQFNETENSEVAIRWEINKMKSKANVAHANFPLWSSWIPGPFDNGHLVAGIRVRQKARYMWSPRSNSKWSGDGGDPSFWSLAIPVRNCGQGLNPLRSYWLDGEAT